MNEPIVLPNDVCYLQDPEVSTLHAWSNLSYKLCICPLPSKPCLLGFLFQTSITPSTFMYSFNDSKEETCAKDLGDTTWNMAHVVYGGSWTT